MKREDIINDLDYAPCQVFQEGTQVEISENVIIDINAIFDHFEEELKEKDHEIKRLRKQLEQFSHIPCRFEYGEPNVE